MNSNIIAAVLHLREASNLLQDVHPELSFTLLRLAGVFVQTDEEMQQIVEMEKTVSDITGDVSDNLSGNSDERAD